MKIQGGKLTMKFNVLFQIMSTHLSAVKLFL